MPLGTEFLVDHALLDGKPWRRAPRRDYGTGEWTPMLPVLDPLSPSRHAQVLVPARGTSVVLLAGA